MALGATLETARRLILGSDLPLALAGVCIGLAGRVGIPRLLGSMMPMLVGATVASATSH